MWRSRNNTRSLSRRALRPRASSPIVAIYSTFLQRAYDQLIHDVALQNLPVVFALDRAGLVGSDGATHQGSYDLTFLRCIPNMVVMAPADENECRQMLYTATTLSSPVGRALPARDGAGRAGRRGNDGAARGPRAAAPRRPQRASRFLRLARWSSRRARLPSGSTRRSSTCASSNRSIEELVVEVAARHRAIVTIEENAVIGGAGSGVERSAGGQWGAGADCCTLGIPDRFIEHGSRETCLAAAGLDLAGLTASVESWWALQTPERVRSVR